MKHGLKLFGKIALWSVVVALIVSAVLLTVAATWIDSDIAMISMGATRFKFSELFAQPILVILAAWLAFAGALLVAAGCLILVALMILFASLVAATGVLLSIFLALSPIIAVAGLIGLVILRSKYKREKLATAAHGITSSSSNTPSPV